MVIVGYVLNVSMTSKMTSYAYNDEYILARQEPQKLNAIGFLGFDLYTRYTNYRAYKEIPDYLREQPNFQGKIEHDSINYKLFISRGASTKNSSEDIQIRQSIADSLINNDPYYKKIFSAAENYWIICNQNDSLIGPLTKAKFLIKRKELKIPDNLQLE